MALSLKKKFVWGTVILAAAVVGTVGTAVYMLTRPLTFEFAQDPNAVEAHEADRKLKLLNDAQTARRRGFVRFSEVEINSFLDGRYNNDKHSPTNSPVKLVKSGVLLGNTGLTFVTWHELPLLGFDLPLVWQRTLSTTHSTNGWAFKVQSMQVGQLQIPDKFWAHVHGILGTGDTLFEERKEWLRSLPLVSITPNEQSKAPEFRLYTYVPTEKTSETPSER